MKQSTLIDNKNIKQTQKSVFERASRTPAENSGKMSPGPVLSGAVARARIVPMDPITRAASKVNAMWKRVRVLRRIMPNPVHHFDSINIYLDGEGLGREDLPTPCNASNTQSHNHNPLPTSVLVTAIPAQGTYEPIFEVDQSI